MLHRPVEAAVRDSTITHLTAKRLDVFTIGLIVTALAFILADCRDQGRGKTQSIHNCFRAESGRSLSSESLVAYGPMYGLLLPSHLG